MGNVRAHRGRAPCDASTLQLVDTLRVGMVAYVNVFDLSEKRSQNSHCQFVHEASDHDEKSLRGRLVKTHIQDVMEAFVE